MAQDRSTSLLRQPAGVYLVAVAEFWERFSYYGMVAMLVLFLSTAMDSGGLGWTKDQALQAYGIFAGLAFSLPAAGGWIADRWLGARAGVLFGALGILLGNLTLFAMTWALRSSLAPVALFVGLGLIVLGTGLLKPTISTLVGRVYDRTPDMPRSAGFTIFLMCIWMGSVAGTLGAGALSEIIGFRWGFLVSALGMAAGLVLYVAKAPALLGDIGLKPPPRVTADDGAAPVGPRLAIPAILLLTAFTAVYATGFYQKAGVLTLMVKSDTNRVVGGVELPASVFLTVSTIGFVILAPLVEILLSRRGRGIDPYVKQVGALLALAVGYLFFQGAAHESATSATGLHSAWWIVAGYLCFSIGDVLIWPPQIATISRLSPPRLTNLLIGVWYVTVGIGNYLAGFLGVYAERMGLPAYFTMIQIGLVASAVLLIIVRARAPGIRAVVATPEEARP